MQSRRASVCFAHFSTKSPSASFALSTQSSHCTNAVLHDPPFMNRQKPHSSSSSSSSFAEESRAPSPPDEGAASEPVGFASEPVGFASEPVGFASVAISIPRAAAARREGVLTGGGSGTEEVPVINDDPNPIPRRSG
jgi:hypothetical protein